WSKPKRVNDDGAGKHQFFNWMAVDPVTGYIHVVFYDRRNYNDSQTDVWLATSKDGGETFQNEKISETPFKPNKYVFFGDYNNISAYKGVVRPIWTRLDGTKLSVWTALIEKK
ncbi:MAG: exo-alpha-sialidase, partial [Bacteroidetes bacterium]